MEFRARAVLGAVMILQLACGGGGGGNGGGGGGSPTLALSPSSATATTGGAGVTFTAVLSGSSAVIAWTLSGPGTLDPASGTSTTYTPPPYGSSATATVTASAGAGVSASAQVRIDMPASVTVSGRVVDSDGMPVNGASVAIGSASTTSGADGRFSVPAVSPPYDLRAAASSPRKVGVLLQGLTRRDPTVVLLFQTTAARHALVTGGLSGGDAPGVTDEVLRIVWGSRDVPAVAAVYPVTSNGTFNFDLPWAGPTSITGTVHALQWKVDANGLPTSYPAYGVRTGVTVNDSATTGGTDLVLSAPTVSTISGSFDGLDSVTQYQKQLFLGFEDHASIFLAADTSPSNTFSFPFPAVPGGAASLLVVGLAKSSTTLTGVEVGGIAPGASNVVLQIPADPSAPLLPLHMATDVGTDVDFTWTPMANVVYELWIMGYGGNPDFHVLTTHASARIPDFSAQGLPLPATAQYSWVMNALGPRRSVDELAVPDAYLRQPLDSFFFADTPRRDFTTR